MMQGLFGVSTVNRSRLGIYLVTKKDLLKKKKYDPVWAAMANHVEVPARIKMEKVLCRGGKNGLLQPQSYTANRDWILSGFLDHTGSRAPPTGPPNSCLR